MRATLWSVSAARDLGPIGTAAYGFSLREFLPRVMAWSFVAAASCGGGGDLGAGLGGGGGDLGAGLGGGGGGVAGLGGGGEEKGTWPGCSAGV